ncbi:hypothetical protein, partial [Aquitalea aquatica]|uniref:hypothetical protein n=1 Tax=Aquitalea aquatica TaxID=3044273 RepID=UPI001C6A27C6
AFNLSQDQTLQFNLIANFLARKIKEINKYFFFLQCKYLAFAKHSHLSVILFFKERCRSLRFVSVAALSAEEANYTATIYPRQHFVRRKVRYFAQNNASI